MPLSACQVGLDSMSGNEGCEIAVETFAVMPSVLFLFPVYAFKDDFPGGLF